MASKFDQVQLETIEQGAFLQRCEAALQDTIDKLVVHLQEQSGGSNDAMMKLTAKASLNMSVELTYAKGVCHIKTDTDQKLPKRPANISTAFLNEDPEHDDRICLFSQSGGTRQGSPHQLEMDLT